MKLTSQQYAEALYDAVHQTADKDHDKVLDNFVKILAANGDLAKHAEIEAEYYRLEQKEKGIKQAEVTFAKEHNPKILDELNAVVGAGLGRPLKSGGVEFKTKLDKGIVGGVIVRVDDTLIDASVKTQLNNLNRELKQ
jgi:F-type H+-transporting ATPase subunit delta